MFTGIIEEIGIVRALSERQLTIEGRLVLENTRLGDSVSVNGACLTVVAIKGNSFTVDIMPETLRRTTISHLHYGNEVNLERAMPAGGRFGGHFVQGHVDAIGNILSITPEGDAVILRISTPSELTRYIVLKGFIAVDGTSLTIIACDDISFSVSLVGYTRKNTTLGKKKHGDRVNLEIDIIAKYVERFTSIARSGNTILDFLQEDDYSTTR